MPAAYMMLRVFVLLGGLIFSVVVSAHHAAFVHFDKDDMVEVTGELVSIDWRNPHTEMVIRATDDAGIETLWLGQERGVTVLARKGVTLELFEGGDTVRIAGFRGRQNKQSLFVTNIMLSDGREVYNESFAEQRWDADLAGTTLAAAQAEKLRNRPVSSADIFRVWSTQIAAFDNLNTNLDRVLWNTSYPLTQYAAETQAAWDSVTENPFLYCQNGMPAIMDQVHPMEFVDQNGDILIRLEEQDIVRTVHMSDDAGDREKGSPLGYSVGHWEGDTLVVKTTSIDWPWFDQEGIPQTEALLLVERFTPSSDGYVLDYTLTATDPAVFTETVELSRSWIWVPGEAVQPNNCFWDDDSLTVGSRPASRSRDD